MANHQTASMKQPLAILLITLGVALMLLLSVSYGSISIPFAAIIELLLNPDESTWSRILWELRVPRAVFAFIIGGLLALAGVLMQALLRNPLADPYILGTSGGAAAAMLIAFLLAIPAQLHAFMALAGAAFSTLILLSFTGVRQGLQQQQLLLSGIILTTGWGALITFLLTAAPTQQIPGMLFWLIGDLGESSSLLLPAATLAVGLLAALLLAKPLDMLLLGDLQAASLGVSVRLLRFAMLSVAVTVTAIAVSVAGPIGFVGLVTPHLVRFVTGASHRRLIPASVMTGGMLMMAADLLSRTIIAPRQMPVGVFTA
ncbi:MAG: iron ABC transporter permease, partial [Pseudomonadota bacterium]|nr:iron ABC transporter permease [Pseudomonadota bacterium]